MRATMLITAILSLVVAGCGASPPQTAITGGSTLPSSSSPLATDFQYTIIAENGSTVLTARFKNIGTEALSLVIRGLDLNLYEPLDKLPITVQLAIGESKEITFTYPAGAIVGTPTLVVPRLEGQGVNGFFRVGSGNDRNYSPTWIRSAASLSVSNQFMPRHLQVKIISISIAGKNLLVKPIELRVAPAGTVRVPEIVLPSITTTRRKNVVLEYGYRLEPNVTWHSSSIDLR
jgi:hypothetical protein